LIIIQCTNLGGMEQSALLLMKELQRQGHECEALSLNPVGKLGGRLESQNIPVQGLEYRGAGGWMSFLKLRRMLKRIQADAMVMVGHNLMAMIAIGKRWHNHRLLSIHYHHRGVHSRLIWWLIYGVAAFRFQSITFPSRFIMDEALAVAPFISRLSCLVSYPIEMPERPATEQRRKSRKRFGLPADAAIVGNAGWLITRKRWDVYFRVAARVLRNLPDTFFLIAGDGPERGKLETLAEDLGVAQQVRWMGWQEDLTDFFLSLDVLLFNSDWDAMGRTPLEAMSYGIPIVASVLNGGLAEVVTTPDIGFFFTSHDVPAMAEAVEQLLSEPEVAARIGEAGRARVEEYGRPSLHADKTLSLLQIDQPVSHCWR
jgi:glycosyltransferase involved in cell wall biosynthesis